MRAHPASAKTSPPVGTRHVRRPTRPTAVNCEVSATSPGGTPDRHRRALALSGDGDLPLVAGWFGSLTNETHRNATLGYGRPREQRLVHVNSEMRLLLLDHMPRDRWP